MKPISPNTTQSENRIIEYELTACAFEWDIAPGKTIQAWGFNGQLPGPA
jgi:hypothetical protein